MRPPARRGIRLRPGGKAETQGIGQRAERIVYCAWRNGDEWQRTKDRRKRKSDPPSSHRSGLWRGEDADIAHRALSREKEIEDTEQMNLDLG